MRRVTLFIILLLTGIEFRAADIKFHSINEAFGISVRETVSINRDENGFVWVSAKAGILRLTDDEYRLYSLPYRTRNVLYVNLTSRKNTLLAFTNNGQVFRYNAVSDAFDFYFSLAELLNDRYLWVHDVLIDVSGKLWIASSRGLYTYADGKLTEVDTKEGEIRNITWMNQETLLVASVKTLYSMNICTGQRETMVNDIAVVVSALFLDKQQNNIWIGTTTDGIWIYSIENKTMKPLALPSKIEKVVRSIEAVNDSTMWCGIDGQGVWEINRDSRLLRHTYKENNDEPYSLNGNGVYDIMHTADRIWVCTYSGGVQFVETSASSITQLIHQWNATNSLVNNNVTSVLEDGQGNLWFATANGLSRLNMKNNRWTSYYNSQDNHTHVFHTLFNDGNGQIFAGAYGHGIYVIDAQTGRELEHYTQKKGILSNDGFIFSILKDTHGDIWAGGILGVAKYNRATRTFHNVDTLSGIAIYDMAVLSDHELLIGATTGLVLYDTQAKTPRDLVSGCIVECVKVIGRDVWLGTNSSGAIRYNMYSGKADTLNVQKGLPSDYVNSLLHVGEYLWLGTENGLCRVRLKDNHIQTFSTFSELSNEAFNRRACTQLADGRLVFGSGRGALIFDAYSLHSMKHKSRIYLQDILISGRSIRRIPDLQPTVPIDSLQEITLDYNQNNVSLELLPIGNIPTVMQFSWKMEGLDKQWSPHSDIRQITYSNLPTGTLTLQIRLYEQSIINERALVIHIRPPFWASWWFRTLVFLVVAGAVVFVARFYINRLKHRHAEDKIRFFTNIAHDLRTSLTLIKAPIEELCKADYLQPRDQSYLKMASQQTHRITTVVTQLLDYQKTDAGKTQMALKPVDMVALVASRVAMFEHLAKANNITIVYTSTPDTYITAVDEFKMEKVINNLISNAVKYSNPNSKVQVSFTGDRKEWRLAVKDEGIGISKQSQKKLFTEYYRSENAVNSKIVGTGVGLILTKNYVIRHGGRIRCESEKGVGSTFEIAIPYKEMKGVLPEPSPLPFVAKASVANKPLIEPTEKHERKILIVEDNDDLRTFIQMPLGDYFNVIAVKDGGEAWEMMQEDMPDLIVSDILMPRMDGFELCKKVKSTFETAHIPIILLTALSDKTNELRGLRLGADDYLTKPFDVDTLILRINNIIQNRIAAAERAIRQPQEDNEPVVPVNNKHNEQFLHRALKVVKEHLSDDEFGREEFASAMNISPSLLYKKLKSLTNLSPNDYITAARMEHAMWLLREKKLSVTEVAERCGYHSLSYFGTTFKRFYGFNPSEVL